MSTGSPQYSETLRQWVHIAFGAAALLLPFLHWYQAVILAAVAVMFNIGFIGRSSCSSPFPPGSFSIQPPSS